MKKIYLSLLVFVFSASVFAGGWLQDFSSGRPSIYVNESQAPDDEWYVTGTGSGFFSNSAWKARASFAFNGIERPESSFIFLDGTGAPQGEFSLVSPAFTPASSESLYYRFQEIKVYDSGNSVPLEIYVEIAEKVDGVWSWPTSPTNILASVTGHNVATTAVTISSTDLSEYAGKEIRIRFRGVAALGDFVAAFYNVAVLNSTVTELAVSAPQNIISQIPKKHAGQALSASSASVQNLGQAIAGNTATVTATVSGSTIATASVPALQPLESSALTFSVPFVPQSFGEYQFQYSLPADANETNNTATSNTFAVTPNTFATDTGTVSNYANNAYGDIGNKFTLTENDRVESISLGWAKLSSDPASLNFQLLIYSLDADGNLDSETPLYTSDILTRPSNAMTLPNGRPATFETYPVGEDLNAGSYIFAIKKSANIGLGSHYDDNRTYYSIEEGELTPTAGVSLLLRVNTASDITLSPAIGSKTTGINEPIVIAGSAVTGISGSPEITIKKADDTNVENVSASYADGKVTITHDAFEYSTTYTVTVPANTITGYASELRWSFTTAGPLTPKTFSPTNNGTNVLLNAPVTLLFDRNIPEGSTLTGITIATDEETPAPVSDVSATKDGALLTIAHAPFVNSTKYKVTVPASAISELAADTSWVFTTVPPLGLATSSPYYPANGATEASFGNTIWVTFNQALDTSSPLNGIKINNTAVTASITAGNPNRVTIDVAGFPFEGGKLYTVVIPAGAVIGYDQEITWSFTTLLPLAPVTFTPAKGYLVAPVNTEISIEFNKNFNIQQMGAGEISIVTAGGTPLTGVTYAIDSDNPKKLVISHTDPLLPNTTYTVSFDNDVVAGYAGISDWTFKTEWESLEIIGFTPENGATNASVTHLVEVAFSKTITLGNTDAVRIGDIVPRAVNRQSTGNGLTNNKLRVDHASTPFTHDTEYTVTIPAGSVAGYDRDTSWTFTTVPVLDYTTSPVDEAVNVALDAPLKIEFNRKALRSTGSANIGITGDNGEEITVTGNSWNTTEDTITIAHAPFDPYVTYTVNVVATSIINTADWTSSESSIVWAFTTGNRLTYTTSPENNATGVALDAPLQITFNRAPVRPSFMVSPSIRIEGGSVALTGIVNWSEDGTVLTIPHGNFATEVTYTVKVATASVINEGYSETDTIAWSFTTGDNTGLQKLSDASGVYPTLTKGNVTVISEPGSLIKILDISGATRANYRAVDRQTPIYLKGATGLYLVVIQNGKSTSVYKVVLKK